VYKSLKNARAKELGRFKRANLVGSPTRMDFCGLFAPEYHTAFNPVSIKNGFRKAGIYLMGRTAVNQEAVASSRVCAETLDSLGPKGLLKPPSSKIMKILTVSCPYQKAVRSMLAGVAELMIRRQKSLHHFQDANCGEDRKKADTDDNPNTSKAFYIRC
jgi:hypothetical protein